MAFGDRRGFATFNVLVLYGCFCPAAPASNPVRGNCTCSSLLLFVSEVYYRTESYLTQPGIEKAVSGCLVPHSDNLTHIIISSHRSEASQDTL